MPNLSPAPNVLSKQMNPEAENVVIGLVDCPALRLHEQFLRRRGYSVRHLPSTDASVLVICPDHASDARVSAAAAAFIGPKLVLGFDAPAAWINTRRLRTPLLPLDLEQSVLDACAGNRPSPSASYSVLVVEDDPTTSASLARTLKEEGFEVRTCGGFAQMAAGLQTRPDFIVMDLNLPGLSGEKLGEIIRGKQIPIAVFSSESAARLEEARLRIGAVAAFPKDTPLRAMAGWIRAHLDAKKG